MRIVVDGHEAFIPDDYVPGGKLRVNHAGYLCFGHATFVHRDICEKVLKRPLLPMKEQVHHVDYNPLNNLRNNLLICDDQYHKLIHRRWDAMLAGFDWRTHSLCSDCKTYHPIEDFPKFEGASREHKVFNICKIKANNRRRGKGYGKFEWKERMYQQFRRAVKKGVPLSVLPQEGRSL